MSEETANISLGLVHWPVVDSTGKTVCTNVTNFDVHDIARASRVYGVRKYFIVSRMQEQLMFVERVLDHWKVGRGSTLNPMRAGALTMVKTAEDVEQAMKTFDEKPLVIATAARNFPELPNISFRQLRARLEEAPQSPVLLLFGTGFGLHGDLLKQCDYVLEPIKGTSADDYRHLSVRSAVSICLDRLLGKW